MQNRDDTAEAAETLEEKCLRLERENAEGRERIRQLTEENAAYRAQDTAPEEEAIEAFLAEFPQAAGFFDDICGVLEAEPELCGAEGLQKAYTRVLAQKYRAPEELAQDEEFLQKNIFCNEQIRRMFIRQYLDSLPQAPEACEKHGAPPVSAHSRPVTLRSAGELARALFRK